MGVVTGIISAPIKLAKGVGNRYRIAWNENWVDDQIAPPSGLAGQIADKVEDVTNFATMGLVARIKDGIKTKGYSSLSNEDMREELLDQYSENITSSANKNADKQKKRWDRLEKKEAKLEAKKDKLRIKDEKIDIARERAENARAMLDPDFDVDDASFEM